MFIVRNLIITLFHIHVYITRSESVDPKDSIIMTLPRTIFEIKFKFFFFFFFFFLHVMCVFMCMYMLKRCTGCN